jgi:hypothetical protein
LAPFIFYLNVAEEEIAKQFPTEQIEFIILPIGDKKSGNCLIKFFGLCTVCLDLFFGQTSMPPKCSQADHKLAEEGFF